MTLINVHSHCDGDDVNVCVHVLFLPCQVCVPREGLPRAVSGRLAQLCWICSIDAASSYARTGRPEAAGNAL